MSSKAISACVSRGFEKYEDDPEFQKKTKKQKLGFLFGICRANEKAKSDFVNDFIDDFVIVDDAGLPGIDAKQPSSIQALQSLLSSIQSPYGLQDETTGYEAAGVLTFTNRPMTPVTSSNVKGVGVFQNDLLVQFWGTQGTYRYHFDTPQEALEASQHMTSGSPGRYVWNHLRGRQIGPAYFSGKPTPGGTSSSIVPYDIAGRTPVPKTPDYDKIAKLLHEYKMSVSKPPESGEPFSISEIKAKQRLDIFNELQSILSGTQITIPEPMKKIFKTKPKETTKPKGPTPKERVLKKVEKLKKEKEAKKEKEKKPTPKEKVLTKVEKLKETKKLVEKIKAGGIEKEGEYQANSSELRQQILKQIKELTIKLAKTESKTEKESLRRKIKLLREAIRRIKNDFVNHIEACLYIDIFDGIQNVLSVYKVKGDFVVDDEITLEGTFTRGGMFWYPEGWKEKDYWQLKELYQKFDFLPAYGQHAEDELIGFGYDWEFIDPTDESLDGDLDVKIVVFDDIIKKYNLKKKDLIDIPVSVRQRDDSANYETRQNITDLFHIAVDLKGEMLDRCSFKGGRPCRVSIVNDGIEIAKGSIPKGKGVASGLVQKFKKLGSDVTRSAISNYIKRDKLMPKKDKDEKDENIKEGDIKDDQIVGSNVHTGEETTGFGYVGAKAQFMSACQQSGGSPAACEETWAKKVATGTGAEGVPKQGEPDVHKYDFAEQKAIMAELKIKLKKVDDFLEVQDKVKADAEEKEATEIRDFLKSKWGKDKCDFVDSLSLEQLRASKQTYEFTEKKLKDDFDMNDKSDGVDFNLITPINDFEGYMDAKMEGLKKEKFGWGTSAKEA